MSPDSFLCQQPLSEVHTLLEFAEPALHLVERLREPRDVRLGGSLPSALVRASDEPSRHNLRDRDHDDDEGSSALDDRLSRGPE